MCFNQGQNTNNESKINIMLFNSTCCNESQDIRLQICHNAYYHTTHPKSVDNVSFQQTMIIVKFYLLDISEFIECIHY